MSVRKYRLVSMKSLILFIYVLVIISAAAFTLKNPAYNWDILPYMGVLLSYDKADAATVHHKVYAIAKEQVPPMLYNRMVDPSSVYRSSVANSPEVFHTQLPFYIVKPLYTGAAYLFYKAGISLPLSTVWPSVVAYFVTSLLLFAWLNKYWTGWYACAGGLLIMLSPPLLTVAGLSTPDALSGLLLFTAVYFLTEKKSAWGTVVFLLLAIFARLDNIIPAAFFLAIIFFGKEWKKKIPAGKKLVFPALLLLAYFAVSYNVRSFGWSILYYPAFVKQLNPSYTANSAFNFAGYVSLIKSQLTTGLFFSFISLFFFLVLLLLWNISLVSFSRCTTEQAVALVFIAIIIVRFILQPLVADRLYIPYYLSVIAFLVKKYSFAKVQA